MVLAQKKVDTENLELQLHLEAPVFLEVCLFDEIGKLVYNFCDFTEAGVFNHQISIKNLSGGTYLLRIAQNGNTSTNEILNIQ